MEQQEYEREIDLRNLLYYVLCRWKLLLAAGLLCMAALGGLKYVSAGRQQVPTEVAAADDDTLQMVQEALDGVRELNTLGGNARLYYNLLLKNRDLDDKIAEYQAVIKGSESQLENLKRRQAEYEQAGQSISAGDGDVLRDMRETMLMYLILNCEKEKISAEYRIKMLEGKKAENEKNAAVLLETIEQENVGQEVVVVVNPMSVAVKFGVVGLAGGLFGMAFILCLLYLFSGELLDAASLKDMHGLRVLSVIPVREAGKGHAGLIGRLKGKAFQTKEEAYDVIYGRMFNLADGLKEKTVLVTGGAEECHVQALIEYLRKKDGSVKYIISMNLMKNLGDLPVFRQADEILLVEQVGKSRLKEISQEMCFIDDVRKRPLGVAVVE